ncbi:MAG: hypothetical protein WCO66_00755 [Candidatus Absconditabacteria bacterium]
METKKRKRIPHGFVTSSTANLAGYDNYFVDIYDEFEQEEPIPLLSEPEVFDLHEVHLNQVNDQICGLPFHRGRGDFIRDVKAGLLKVSSNIHSVGGSFLETFCVEASVQNVLQSCH